MKKEKIIKYGISSLVWFFFSCDPLVTTFKNIEDAIFYEANNFQTPPETGGTLKVMTWNIRFGIGRLPFFGDSCGERSIFTEREVLDALELIAGKINEVNPDVLLLQEVDRESKRTAYIDQVQWILDHTNLNYAAYASMWQAQVIPSDGIGRIDVGNAVMTKWNMSSAERIKLPLRTDQDSATQLFYIRRNILKAKVYVPEIGNIYALNSHTTAFATDETKRKHIEKVEQTLDIINQSGDTFVAGGDLNALSFWATQRDFCAEDRCTDEICDGDYENNKVYQGSYFSHLENEDVLLSSLYKSYSSAIDSSILKTNETDHFTHSTSGDSFWNRKLDYIFTNKPIAPETGTTHQDVLLISDHAPVSCTVIIEQ